MPKEVILHIGQAKTGTTSLQRRLARQRGRLLENGINYPNLVMNDFNHRCLAPAVFGGTNFPADVKLALGETGEEIVKTSKAQWKVLRQTFDQDLLILSGENFFYPLDGMAGARLKWFISMGGYRSYRVLSYIRNPSDRYLSIVQERLKVVSGIMELRADPFMNVLTSYRKIFGSDFHVRLYGHEQLIGADILKDFSDWVGTPGPVIDTELKTDKPNISLSAEAMAVLARLQGRRRDKTKSEIMLNRKKINALRNLDRQTEGATKPILKPWAKAFIEKNSPELLALRDEFGLSFPDVDYAAIKPGQKSAKKTVSDLSKICRFNKERSEILVEGLKRKFTAAELNLAD